MPRYGPDLGALGDLWGRPEWHADAACRGHGIDAWFPVPANARNEVAAARAVCSTCPVQRACLRWALAQPATLAGVWAGTTQGERAHLRAPS
ncbi:MAG: WhiB family transcriptional regulator [Acidimicrobiia bacterium]|nr:WhiB family transcriptional regulator [Acidimicrobiia bacterium]